LNANSKHTPCSFSGASAAIVRRGSAEQSAASDARPADQRLVLPMRHGEQTVAVLELAFSASPALSPAQLAFLGTLAQLAAQVLTRCHGSPPESPAQTC
jgi:GAF domain-containing protein